MRLKKTICTCMLIVLLTAMQSCATDKKQLTAAEKPLPITVIVKKDSVPNKDTAVPVPAHVMQFEIVFESAPGAATATTATLKYNKTGWVSMEWDDSFAGALSLLSILKNKYYTDGCGNAIAYAAAVAVNGRSNYNNVEMGAVPGTYLTYDEMKALIAAGWDIENHSFYHEPVGNFNFGADRDKNIEELDNLIVNRIGYKMNGHVVPTNYEGFAAAAKKFGYLFSTSQNVFDGLPPGNPDYKDVKDFDLAPVAFGSFARMFYDNWADMETSAKAAFDVLITKNNQYFRMASHTSEEGAFTRLLNYFYTKGNDKILIVPTREVMEYRVMAALPVKYQVAGNKLIVSIDTETLSNRIRWKDMSFIVKADAKIVSINAINGIDKTSFNAATGLVNIFKQTTLWK